MIRTYQAEHGGLAFEIAPTRRQKARRNRLTALAVIAAVAASAGLLQHFSTSTLGGSAMPIAPYSAAR